MKLIWLTNMIPGAVKKKLGQSGGDGLWIDHMLSDVENHPELSLTVLCRGGEEAKGQLSESVSYETYLEALAQGYYPELEQKFEAILKEIQPDVIHIWGTEYGHTLAMVRAAKACGMQNRLIVSIQGLCSVIARHYLDGIPERIARGITFRDALRDSPRQQQAIFAHRGEMEVEALRDVPHVLGRTHWDRRYTKEINPQVTYHHCGETLRECFYSGSWSYPECTPHRIMTSSADFTYKGFHYLLEAFRTVLKDYPDAEIVLPGKSFSSRSFQDRLRQQSYPAYLEKLVKQYGLQQKITFLGRLSGEEMKKTMLGSHVFVLPSAIENSPNSLGEAMLLGVPCVAADVGGVTTMLEAGEGIVYPAGDAESLARGIMEVFRMGASAETMGSAARSHALKTHDPETNLKALLDAYAAVAQQ